jgi:hypothetical protein
MGLLDNLSSVLSTVNKALKSDAAQQIISAVTQAANNGGNFDIADGLKAALKVGIETAATNLGKEDGYLADAAVRIGMPKEALSAFSAVQSLSNNPAFNSLLSASGVSIPTSDTIITLFNRAAESAAPKSVDIFVDAITGMSIADAKTILFGADNAATTYLRNNTITQLQGAFNPSITDSLNKVQIANVTPITAWNTYATYNNKLVELLDSKAAKAALEVARMTGVIEDKYFEMLRSIEPVDGNLPNYITGQALDGLFLKVSEKECDIRHNASARVSDVLQNVFGQLDKK